MDILYEMLTMPGEDDRESRLNYDVTTAARISEDDDDDTKVRGKT